LLRAREARRLHVKLDYPIEHSPATNKVVGIEHPIDDAMEDASLTRR
jgi:low affinity Fe/Cu permease